MLEPARKEDWEDIRSLSVQIHDLHAAWRPDIYYHTFDPYPLEDFLEDCIEELVYVAREQGKIVGYVILSIIEKGGPGTVESTQLRLDSICVDEAMRGRGIGKMIMSDVCELAKTFNCSSLLLGVHPENTNALAFYEKCGFSVRTINMERKI